jgi:dTDP-4-amino-4,6-dideoxygalactose transaminase
MTQRLHNLNRPGPAAPAWKITLSDLDYGPEEEEAVLRVLRSKWITMGAETKAFEQEFATAIGTKHAIAVSNGTAALHLAYLALGLGPGDEVIQPAVNFVAAANSTVLVGARPVFADIEGLGDPTVALREIERRLTKNTKAVVVMHYGGAPCEMDPILELCRSKGIAVVEDACHGVGGAYHGRKMGSLGDIAAFSFFSNKNMAVGEGGMVTTNRDDLAERVRVLRSHGMTTMSWDRHRGHAFSYDVGVNGLNYRLDEIRAALGREQLRKLDRNNTRRRKLARKYHEMFARLIPQPLRARCLMPELGLNGDEAAHHLLVMLMPNPDTRTVVSACLKEQGIQTSAHYPLVPAFTAFAGRSPDGDQDRDLPASWQFCNRVLTLPLHPNMSEADVETVLLAVRSALASVSVPLAA